MGADRRPPEFDADYWEQHYRRHEHEHDGPDVARTGQGPGVRGPSPHLVAVVEELGPGRVLDAGCGEGDDTAWLASQGWRVTAVDVAPTALRRARDRVETLGGDVSERVEWVAADLSTWTPEPEAFDLVSAQYVHVPERHRTTVFGALSAAVAPGGTLLVVDHDPKEHGTHAHDHDPHDHDPHDHDPHDHDPHDHGPHGAGADCEQHLDDSERPHPQLSLTAADLVGTLDPALWEVHTEATPDVVLRARRLSGSG
jgi:SAM-dependent methyltransferase